MVRIAILDLNEGQPNQGMRCLREIINQWSTVNGVAIVCHEFEVRIKKQIPDLNYDIYISSGGPGSPLDSEGSEWEALYFNWLQQVTDWNNEVTNTSKKFVFLICHSFQLVCRYLQIGHISKRKSTAFGVFPVHLTESGKQEKTFRGLNDPFYVVDSRDYQITQPDNEQLNLLGASILCIEKDRPHVPYERAIMAVRFNDYMIGTQFHPEADAIGMSRHFQTEEKKKMIIENYGEEKWRNMVAQLNDPDKIMWTYAHILPNFLNDAITSLATKGELGKSHYNLNIQ